MRQGSPEGKEAPPEQEPDLEVLDFRGEAPMRLQMVPALRAQLESETEAMKVLLAALKDMLREMAGWEEQYGVAARIADVASERSRTSWDEFRDFHSRLHARQGCGGCYAQASGYEQREA